VGALDTYFPEGDKTSSFTVYGYVIAQTIVQVLKQCGDELTRENVMRQAANLKDFELGLSLPGIKINTSSNDYFPVEQMQMSKFNGEYGELFGPVISGESERNSRCRRRRRLHRLPGLRRCRPQFALSAGASRTSTAV
jgi:hypothetical protein